jgi:hypothetical protein
MAEDDDEKPVSRIEGTPVPEPTVEREAERKREEI